MPRLNPDRRMAHALQTLAVARRMLKDAENGLRAALKQRKALVEGVSKSLALNAPAGDGGKKGSRGGY